MKSHSEKYQKVMQAAQDLISYSLDWDTDSEFVEVRKKDFDALARSLDLAGGRA